MCVCVCVCVYRGHINPLTPDRELVDQISVRNLENSEGMGPRSMWDAK